jgi:hypothetical protein
MMEKLEGNLQSFAVTFAVVGVTTVALLWGIQNRGRSNANPLSPELQQQYKYVYDSIELGTPYQEIDDQLEDAVWSSCKRAFQEENLAESPSVESETERQEKNLTDKWCTWKGGKKLTLSVKFDAEGGALEKKFYYDKAIGLE